MNLDLSAVGDFSFWAYALVFAGGVATSIGPCNVTMIPLVVAYVGGQQNVSRGRSLALSATFALGLAITLMALGVAAALVGRLIGPASQGLWYYLVAAVCIFMGLYLLKVITVPLPDWAAQARERIKRRGLLGALLLGLVSGLAASGCATPALAAILTLVMSRGAIVYGASLLLVYGIGRGVPIVAIGAFTGALKRLPALLKWSDAIERISGALMVCIGLYFVWIA